MKTDEIMLKVENVSKVYKLGEIGGTTLRDELQRLKAKILKREDPTKKIGAKNYNKGEKFKALYNISFEVKKSERIGIIGHNGAGKSTLLKLISRVTGPTEGNIYLNGRVASMLEVGTGFHPELTGRENIYMNGAILGMTKKEIDAKMEEIIDFSEVRPFIDTPVKRYSSGMYVKLAFSVAAHLDSEIMIMDEVLAVGDLNFQLKCLNKMKDAALIDGKTILYVSHNMNTIRNLCDRVIVLKKGEIIFDGDVEKGISIYMNNSSNRDSQVFDYTNSKRLPDLPLDIKINSCRVLFNDGNQLKLRLTGSSRINEPSIVLRIVVFNEYGLRFLTSYTKPCCVKHNVFNVDLDLNISIIVNGFYKLDFVLSTFDGKSLKRQDVINDAVDFEIGGKNDPYGIVWQSNSWGNINGNETLIKEVASND